MAISSCISTIAAELSAGAKILTDSTSEEFKTSIERWTDLDLQVPGAIVVVATENDILKSVQLAIKHSVPFVAKAGGHSSWSTIGSQGIIIDLSHFKNVLVDKTTQTVHVQAGVLNQQLIAALYDEGLCVPLGGGNTIGSVPQALGGGICALSHLCGNTGQNIVSAKLITAAGKLITVDSATPDLLWALKGAGQFFGLVTELTLQAYPLSILGTSDGTIWSGTFIFAVPQITEIAKVIETLIDSEAHAACLCVITTSPMSGEPCVLVMPFFFGPEAAADQHFAPLKTLQPLMAMGGMVSYRDVNNGLDPFCVKGGFKRFHLVGLPRFPTAPWAKIADIFVELGKACPDAKMGGYGFEFISGKKKSIEQDSAWTHGDVKFWVESLSWYTNLESGAVVDKLEAEAIAVASEGFSEDEKHIYQNFSRESTLESRFGGKVRVEKLRVLKQTWDPTGVFTRQLL